MGSPLEWLNTVLSSGILNQSGDAARLHDFVDDLRTSMLGAREAMDHADRWRFKPEHHILNQYLRDLRGAMIDAEDLIGELGHEELKLKVEETQGHSSTSAGRQILQKFPEFFGDLLKRNAKRVSEAQKKIDAKTKQVTDYLSQEKLDDWKRESKPLMSITTSLRPEFDFLGREREVEEILDIILAPFNACGELGLVTSDEPDPNTQMWKAAAGGARVLPIVGIGGVGKTTLAREVYNDLEVKERFDLLAWVCTSHRFEKIALTKSIVIKLGEEVSRDRANDLNYLQTKLTKVLEANRTLLIFDDFWNENSLEWTNFYAPFMHAKRGSVIIVTTRHPLVVASMTTGSIMEPIYLKGLPDEYLWILFKDCAFGSDNLKGYEVLENIGWAILPKLCGSPLAAQTVGRLLSTNLDVKHWQKVRDSELCQLKEHNGRDILPSIRLSYQYLPSHLKSCLSICARFEKNFSLSRDELIYIWIAHGLVDCPLGKRVEDVAIEYLQSLADRFFLLKDHSKKRDEYYRMHDLMHDVASDENIKYSQNTKRDESPAMHKIAKEMKWNNLYGSLSIGGLQVVHSGHEVHVVREDSKDLRSEYAQGLFPETKDNAFRLLGRVLLSSSWLTPQTPAAYFYYCVHLTELPVFYGRYELLTSLEIIGCDKLASLVKLSPNNLPQLKSLYIGDCVHLVELPADGFEGFSLLENLTIRSCRKISSLRFQNLQALKVLQFDNLQALKELHIEGCQKLQSLGPLHALDQIPNVLIRDNPMLLRIEQPWIRGDARFCKQISTTGVVGDDKVHVAVGWDEAEGRSLLLWASVTFPMGMKFVLLNVHQSFDNFQPGKEKRNSPISELLMRYVQFCDVDLKFQPEVEWIANSNVAAGILNAIESHRVTKLVIGGSDRTKSNRPTASNWSTSTIVCKNAELFCNIFVISEGALVFVSKAHKNPLELSGFLPTSASSSKERQMQISVAENCPFYKNAPVLYGIEDHYKSLVEQLLSNNFHENGMNIFCILAESGYGKTSLAHLVYNSPTVRDSFDTTVWVRISKEMNINILMMKIIEFITHVCITSTAQSFLKEIVEEKIRDKRLLIVMDDADIEDQLFWSETLSILSSSRKGSKLLMTTKNSAVVSMVKPIYCCHLIGFSEEHCLSILKQFSGGDDHTNIQSFSKKMSALSGGLPLYAKALSGYLCQAKEVDLLLVDSLKERKIATLSLCFYTLPQQLKRFCIFCSTFPKGYIFVKYPLVGLWVALDYTELTKRGDPEDAAIEDFNNLFSRSFFQHSPFHGFEEDKYVMHELMYDLVKEVSGAEYIEKKSISLNVSQGICCLSVKTIEYTTAILSHLADGIINLESLLTTIDSGLQDYFMSFPTLRLEGLDDLLIRIPRLILLDLSYTCMENLPDSVWLLKNLRHLAVNCTEIKCLTPEIGSMKDLLTLQAKDCPHLFELPESMIYLTNLRHLDVRKEFDHVSMPVGLGQLTNIQTLEIFSVGNSPKHCSIGELKNLESLRGSIKITGLEHVQDPILARQANLLSKGNLKSLTLQWHNCMDFKEEDAISAQKVLEELQAHHNLQKLAIKNYPGYSFPSWIGNASFVNLLSVELYCCYSCSEFPELGKLPALKYLSVLTMCDVQKVGRHTLNTSNTEIFAEFQALEQLKLWDMPDLEDLSSAGGIDFKQLQTLSISRCPKLENLPSIFSLVKLFLHCCPKLYHIPDFPSLTSLRIEGLQGVEVDSIVLSPNLPVLRKLEIICCSNVVNIHGLSDLTSIEELKVERCPMLDLVTNWKQYHHYTMCKTRWGAVSLCPDGLKLET